jgi:glucan-binding YG repeat protein
MRVKKLNFRRIISYLLIFSVFFTSVQIGLIKRASAGETNQVPGLNLIVGDATSGTQKIIDKDQNEGYICEFIPINKNITLTAQSGYTITGVSSDNSKYMSINQQNAIWIISNITDYSDFNLKVTINNGTQETTYTIKIRFEADSSLEFGYLNVKYDTQQQAIPIAYGSVNTDGNYALSADSSVKTATITMTDKTGAPMTFSANGGSSGTQSTITLAGGENDIKITRTYLNISKQYTLVINKKGQAKLKILTPSAGSLSPGFNSDIYDYTITVPTTQSTIAFTPVSADNSSTIKVDGSTVTSGKKSKNISLDEGDNKIDIEVTTKDGDTNTYTVDVTRTEQFRSANLKGLTLTSGTLSPTFNKGVYEYTATVNNDVTSVGIKPIAEDSNATITVNDKTVPSGATSPYISLDEGGNSINVIVTDTKDNSNTYVINVTRKYSKNNVNLADLSVTDGTMSPRFDPESYNYSVKVDRNIEKVRVLYTSQNDKSKVKINGKEYTNGQSDYISLKIGANLSVVEITAEDGTTTTTYKLSIIRGDIQGKNEWVLVAGEWMFYNADGIPVKNDWVKYDNQFYFLDINGHMQTGWLYESGKWYFLNDSGIMITGWKYDKGYWYYLQGDGAMKTNAWASYDGKWYYFNNYGQMQTGWVYYLGKYYFLNDHGEMQKGWITWDKNQYYLNDDGTMRNGWLYNGKVWYYLDNSGKMVRGWQNINGKNYYFDDKGVMKTGLMFLDGQWINLNNA